MHDYYYLHKNNYKREDNNEIIFLYKLK